jgi:enamine deaminase RidA (YjgF/YER057c/UK114 family)
LLFLAGNTAAPDWKFKGKVGKDLTVQEGYDTARQVGLIMLAKVRAALGSLDRVKRVVKVLGMVNSADGFGDQPRVINGFSDLMVEAFGEAIGKHARSAVGMAGLPFNNHPCERSSSRSTVSTRRRPGTLHQPRKKSTHLPSDHKRGVRLLLRGCPVSVIATRDAIVSCRSVSFCWMRTMR